MPNHCISHGKDVDGLSSAALVLAARGGSFRVTDYDELFDELDAIPAGTDSLVMCDLGTDTAKFDRFSSKLTELSRKMSVTYIDHHFLSPELQARLRALPITFVHDPSECASMLTYLTLRPSLPESASYLALFGAVTDYMDSSPHATKVMERFDRQYVLLQSTLLSYAIANNAGEYSYLDLLVRELASMKRPSAIENVPTLALRQAEVMAELETVVGQKGVKLGRLAYMETAESSTGNVAKLLLGAFDVVVGVSFKKKDGDRAEMSLRGTSECRVHLGQTISEIASRHAGNGGGHQKAAGCSVPVTEVTPLLNELAQRV